MNNLQTMLTHIKKLHSLIRESVLNACEQTSIEQLSTIVEEAKEDTIYAVDRFSEDVLIEYFEKEVAPDNPMLLIAEGIPNGQLLLPRGISQDNAMWQVIIDPIDGTHNYARRLPMFGVSIALEHQGKVVLGVIGIPYFDEIYTAEKGGGAFLNGEKLRVSDVELDKSLMIYDTKLRFDKEPMIGSLSDLVHEVFIIRMFGCATWDLCTIAKGQAEFSVDFTAKPWDLAAGALIVEEAGGRVTDLKGNNWNAYSAGFIASNSKLHEEVLSIVNP